MFQYALGRNLALKNNTILKFDVSELEQDKLRNYELAIFNIPGNIASKFTMMFIRMFNNRIISKISAQYYLYIKQQDPYFNEKILLKKGNIYLDGYWQSENYFKEIRNIIIKDFTIKFEQDKRNKSMIKKIKNSNSVCIHIRRGDYFSNAKTNKFHGLCSFKYYYNAIEIIVGKVKNPTFFIFSDDSQWTKENLKLKYSAIYVNINSPKKGYEDLRLISNCKHFIIANSSFGWWGAWLSDNPNKIVCAPKRWFRSADEGDIVPKSWIRVED
jgi:hypothetical protein